MATRRHAPQSILDGCQRAWANFKEFTHRATQGAVIHVLVVPRSHYPSVKPDARGTSAAKITKLEDKVEEVVVKLASDVDLFGEKLENA